MATDLAVERAAICAIGSEVCEGLGPCASNRFLECPSTSSSFSEDQFGAGNVKSKSSAKIISPASRNILGRLPFVSRAR
jgi:hypothetical protein